MMSRVQKGLVAGLAATVVVSIIEAINMTVGHGAVAFPQLLGAIASDTAAAIVERLTGKAPTAAEATAAVKGAA